MQKSLIINNLEFAQNALKLDEAFEASHLTRLSEMLVPNAKIKINIELTGAGKQFRQPSLHLRIKTELSLICQRCLDEMLMPIDLSFDYLLGDAVDSAQDDDDTEWLEIDQAMNLLDLIEDELLMALPIAPTHAHKCSQLSTKSGEKPNPFAVLKSLKKS